MANRQQKAPNTKNAKLQKPNISLKSRETKTANPKKQNSAKGKQNEPEERDNIVFWRQPILTLKYCCYEVIILLQTYLKKLTEHKYLLALFFGLLALLSAFYNVPGRHQVLLDAIRSNIGFVIYWVGLGVLSSIGLGSGLHTFILYLGPHIASVTLAAQECNSLDFPSPPYPDEVICPAENVNSYYIPSLWSIMNKVRFEAFLWGAGTAIGELPPYLMARAARLSEYDPDDEDDELKEFKDLKKKSELGVKLTLLDQAKLTMERIVERVGFFGIVACASIPNPLFDLAGITCGHFLMPFWTFFGATLFGKAIIKINVQTIFVIIAFNESLIAKAVDILGQISAFGWDVQEPFKMFLQNQKARLHRSSAEPPTDTGNILSKILEIAVVLMIFYFILSLVNSLAQNYHKRIHKKGGKANRKIE